MNRVISNTMRTDNFAYWIVSARNGFGGNVHGSTSLTAAALRVAQQAYDLIMEHYTRHREYPSSIGERTKHSLSIRGGEIGEEDPSVVEYNVIDGNGIELRLNVPIRIG